MHFVNIPNKKMANLNWTADELLLALDLFFRLDGRGTTEDDRRVQELSALLRVNPAWGDRRLAANFRSAAAVVSKLSNISFVSGGPGMSHAGRLDREIWRTYGHRPEYVRQQAEVIRRAIRSGARAAVSEIEDIEFKEGGLVTRQHRFRERNPNVRKKVLASRLANGEIECEICEVSFPTLHHKLKLAAFEVHHLVPVASAGERTVRIRDMALLCATCHRQLHALISNQQDWVDLQTARQVLCNNL